MKVHIMSMTICSESSVISPIFIVELTVWVLKVEIRTGIYHMRSLSLILVAYVSIPTLLHTEDSPFFTGATIDAGRFNILFAGHTVSVAIVNCNGVL